MEAVARCTRTGSRRTLGLRPNQAREALFGRCWLLPGARTAPQEATHASCSPVLLVAQRGRRASRPAVRDSPVSIFALLLLLSSQTHLIPDLLVFVVTND